MKVKIIGISFIFSVFIYFVLAHFLNDKVRKTVEIPGNYFFYAYLFFILIYFISLYFGKFKEIQKRIFSFAMAEVPPIFSFALFLLTKDLKPLFYTSLISILILIYLTFLSGERNQGLQ